MKKCHQEPENPPLHCGKSLDSWRSCGTVLELSGGEFSSLMHNHFILLYSPLSTPQVSPCGLNYWKNNDASWNECNNVMRVKWCNWTAAALSPLLNCNCYENFFALESLLVNRRGWLCSSCCFRRFFLSTTGTGLLVRDELKSCYIDIKSIYFCEAPLWQLSNVLNVGVGKESKDL